MTTQSVGWRVAFWLSLATWLTAGVLVMMRWRGGWLTSYGDDLALPLWLYIAARSLAGTRAGLLHRTIGRSPESAFAAISLASIGTEISQYFQPHGLFPGTFDPLDIVMYVIGAGAPYLAEKLTAAKPPTGNGDRRR